MGLRYYKSLCNCVSQFRIMASVPSSLAACLLFVICHLSILLWYYITDYWPELRRPFCLDVIPIRELIVIAIHRLPKNPFRHKPPFLGSVMLIPSVFCVYKSILKYSSQIGTNKTARGEMKAHSFCKLQILLSMWHLKSKSLVSFTKILHLFMNCHSARHPQSFRVMNGLPVETWPNESVW